MLLPSGTPLMLPLPQLGTETIATEKAAREEDRESEAPDTKPVAANRAPSPSSSAPEKQAQ